MQIRELIGVDVEKTLLKGINSGFKLPSLADPDKDLKLWEDYKWVDFHIDYAKNVNRIFQMSLDAGIEESNNSIFLNVNTPILVNAVSSIETDPEYSRFALGWHVNCLMLKMPTVFISREMMGNLEEWTKIMRGSRFTPSHKFEADYVRYLRSRNSQAKYDFILYYFLKCNEDYVDPFPINWVGNLPHFSSEHILNSFRTVIGDHDYMEQTDFYGFARDVESYKSGVFNVTPDNCKPVKIRGKMYYAVPLFPKGFASRSMKLSVSHPGTDLYWEILQ